VLLPPRSLHHDLLFPLLLLGSTTTIDSHPLRYRHEPVNRPLDERQRVQDRSDRHHPSGEVHPREYAVAVAVVMAVVLALVKHTREVQVREGRAGHELGESVRAGGVDVEPLVQEVRSGCCWSGYVVAGDGGFGSRFGCGFAGRGRKKKGWDGEEGDGDDAAFILFPLLMKVVSFFFLVVLRVEGS